MPPFGLSGLAAHNLYMYVAIWDTLKAREYFNGFNQLYFCSCLFCHWKVRDFEQWRHGKH